jgi:glutamine amidotransferase
MIAVINYGLGNLHSVQKALAAVGGSPQVTADPQMILRAEKVVLPGVGAFADGMEGLNARGLSEVVKEVARNGTPLLGICLGMQLFFETSEELGDHQGLGLLNGSVKAFRSPGIKIPQIGWNQLIIREGSALLADLPPGSYVYFNHGFYCDAEDQSDVLAKTDYGIKYPSVVKKDNVFGVQFHPEKSQQVGLRILKIFVEYQDE